MVELHLNILCSSWYFWDLTIGALMIKGTGDVCDIRKTYLSHDSHTRAES